MLWQPKQTNTGGTKRLKVSQVESSYLFPDSGLPPGDLSPQVPRAWEPYTVPQRKLSNRPFHCKCFWFLILGKQSDLKHTHTHTHTHTHPTPPTYTHTHHTHTQGSSDSAYLFGSEFAIPQSRVFVFREIKHALTFSGSFTLSESCVFNASMKRRFLPTVSNLVPDIQLEAEVFFLRQLKSQKDFHLLTCLYIAPVPLSTETAEALIAGNNIWTISFFKVLSE